MIKFEYNTRSPHDGFSEKITFEFDNYGTPASEVFEQWVRFMNAIGYHLDPVEMEAMWNGEISND